MTPDQLRELSGIDQEEMLIALAPLLLELWEAGRYVEPLEDSAEDADHSERFYRALDALKEA